MRGEVLEPKDCLKELEDKLDPVDELGGVGVEEIQLGLVWRMKTKEEKTVLFWRKIC